MKDFFKNNGHLIWRLILNQIGLTIFGLMTSMAASAIDLSLSSGDGTVSRTCMIWVSVFTIIFYMFINYMAVKEEGQRDKIRADAGRITRDPLRGLKVVLTASALNIALGIAIIVFGLLGAENGPALEWAGNISGSAKLLALVIQAMYWGVMLGLPGLFGLEVATFADVPSFCYILITLPSVIICTLGYIAGLHEFSIFKRIKSFFTPEGK